MNGLTLPAWMPPEVATAIAVVGGLLVIYRNVETIEKIFKRLFSSKTEKYTLEYHNVQCVAGYNGRTGIYNTAEARIHIRNPYDTPFRLRVDRLNFKMQGQASSLTDENQRIIDVGRNTESLVINSNPVLINPASKIPFHGYIDIEASFGLIDKDGKCKFDNKFVASGILDVQIIGKQRIEYRFTPYEGTPAPSEFPGVVSEDDYGWHMSR